MDGPLTEHTLRRRPKGPTAKLVDGHRIWAKSVAMYESYWVAAQIIDH
jgi:hypothetical protein